MATPSASAPHDIDKVTSAWTFIAVFIDNLVPYAGGRLRAARARLAK